jgi:uncharacterized RDD family membrane protein YckC
MYCQNCGKAFLEGEKFCSNCGTGLAESLRGLRYSSLLLRILAYVIDAIIIMIPMVLILLFYLTGKYGEELFNSTLLSDTLLAEMTWFTLATALVFFTYFSLLEGRFQASIGKKLLGMRVVNRDHKPIGFTQSLLRNALRLLWDLPLIGLVFVVVDIVLILIRHQRIGDMAAKTFVMSA